MRTGGLHELLHGSGGVAVEDAAALFYHLFQPCGGGGESGDGIAGFLHLHQQVVERRCHVHPFGHKRALSGTFEVEDGNLLVLVGLALQRDVVVHRGHEVDEAVGDSLDARETVPAGEVGEEGEGTYGAVNFGRHYALREETAVHPHLVGHPFLVVAVGVDG